MFRFNEQLIAIVLINYMSYQHMSRQEDSSNQEHSITEPEDTRKRFDVSYMSGDSILSIDYDPRFPLFGLLQTIINTTGKYGSIVHELHKLDPHLCFFSNLHSNTREFLSIDRYDIKFIPCNFTLSKKCFAKIQGNVAALVLPSSVKYIHMCDFDSDLEVDEPNKPMYHCDKFIIKDDYGHMLELGIYGNLIINAPTNPDPELTEKLEKFLNNEEITPVGHYHGSFTAHDECLSRIRAFFCDFKYIAEFATSEENQEKILSLTRKLETVYDSLKKDKYDLIFDFYVCIQFSSILHDFYSLADMLHACAFREKYYNAIVRPYIREAVACESKGCVIDTRHFKYLLNLLNEMY